MSVDSYYSYLGALKFFSSSFKKTSNKRQNTQNNEEIPKFDMSNSGIYKCLIPGIWIYQEPMSQRRKQLYGDFYVLRVFYPFLISLWACFEKSAMFCCECWWVSIEERRSLIIPDANYFDKKTVLHVIITSTLLLYPLCFAEILEKNSFSLLFYSFLLYLLFHIIKWKFCCEFIWLSQWKKKKKGNK